MNDFIPGQETEKVKWYDNLSAKAAAQGIALGLNAAQITELQNICSGIKTAIKVNSDAQTAAQTAKIAKDQKIIDGEKQLRAFIRTIKASSGYNDAVAKDFLIVGEESVFDPSSYKPVIKAKVMPGRVVIEFVKSKLDGVNIYVRLKGQSLWTKLAYDSYSPYEDNRPLAVANTPEHREYMAIGVIQDAAVTLQSDIIEAVYGG
jgi:hypothetical protein